MAFSYVVHLKRIACCALDSLPFIVLSHVQRGEKSELQKGKFGCKENLVGSPSSAVVPIPDKLIHRDIYQRKISEYFITLSIGVHL